MLGMRLWLRRSLAKAILHSSNAKLRRIHGTLIFQEFAHDSHVIDLKVNFQHEGDAGQRAPQWTRQSLEKVGI